MTSISGHSERSSRRRASELAEAGITELPDYVGHRERLRERFLTGGPEALPDDELLELLLFMAIPRTDVKPLAKATIDKFGSFPDVIAAPVERLKKFDLTDNTIAAIKVVEAASSRLAPAKVIDRPALSSSEALLDYCASAMGRLETEEFHVLFLDRKNVLIADECLQKGTVDHFAGLSPRSGQARARTERVGAHPGAQPSY